MHETSRGVEASLSTLNEIEFRFNEAAAVAGQSQLGSPARRVTSPRLLPIFCCLPPSLSLTHVQLFQPQPTRSWVDKIFTVIDQRQRRLDLGLNGERTTASRCELLSLVVVSGGFKPTRIRRHDGGNLSFALLREARVHGNDPFSSWSSSTVLAETFCIDPNSISISICLCDRQRNHARVLTD